MNVSSYEYCIIFKIIVNIFGTFFKKFLLISTAPIKKHKGVYMKIKIKYDIKDIEGLNKKSYAKTFTQVNEAAKAEDFKNFAMAYLSLVKNNGNTIKFKVYKTNEEEITNGNTL